MRKNNIFKCAFSLLNYYLLNEFSGLDWPNKMFSWKVNCLLLHWLPPFDILLQLPADPVSFKAKSM